MNTVDSIATDKTTGKPLYIVIDNKPYKLIAL